MLYHTQHPAHRHGGNSMGYRQSEPYRMQQDYQTPYIKRYDKSFEKVVEERGGQRRGNYESSWDTLYWLMECNIAKKWSILEATHNLE